MNLEDAQKEMQITVHRFVKNNSQYSVVGNITALQILRTWELLQKREELYSSVEKGVEIHKIKLVPLNIKEAEIALNCMNLFRDLSTQTLRR